MAEALGEVAKHISTAFTGVLFSAKPSSSSAVASPANSIDNRSKCYKQLGDLNELRTHSGVLTEEEYHSEKEAIMITLKKLYKTVLLLNVNYRRSPHCCLPTLL